MPPAKPPASVAPSAPRGSPPVTAPAAELPFMEAPAKPMPGWLLMDRGYARMNEGRDAEALALYLRAMELGNTHANTAYYAAHLLARQGRKQEAVQQLARAAEWGFRDVEWLRRDEKLASLRTEPAFTALMARIPTLPPPKDAVAHEELRRLSEEDLADALAAPSTSKERRALRARGEERLSRVKALAAAGALKSGGDFFAAASILYKRYTLEDAAQARELGAEAARRGHPTGLWLAANAWDLWLKIARRPQRFGTQYSQDPQTRKLTLYPVDPSVTDEERARWGIPPLAEIPAALP